MQFTNSRERESRVPQLSLRRMGNPGLAAAAAAAATAATAATAPRPKTMIWGEPTWFLFHTLAHKVKDEAFPIVRQGLLDVIVKVCSNLPCPTCAEHATQFLQTVNFAAIQTKQNLKDLLFRFHNLVNAKKSFPLFAYAELDEKYNAANTGNIILNFMKHFEGSTPKLEANHFSKMRTLQFLKQWFSQNLQYFEP